MKNKGPILFRKYTDDPHRSFLVRHARVPHLYNNYHYHRELELLYVVRGEGTRFVGDGIAPFFGGDLVLVGSNVPHFWKSDERYFAHEEGLYAEVILLQFVPDLFGDTLQLAEFAKIRSLVTRAQLGIEFSKQTRLLADTILWQLVDARGGKRMLLLLELLELLANSEDFTPLSQFDFQQVLTDASSLRIQATCNFLMSNYRNKITLNEAATVANLSEKAFCRFFKRATQKTLIQFITELRVSHACKLLLSNSDSIGNICFQSGFNNLSNFNRVFKKEMGCSPRNYRHALTS